MNNFSFSSTAEEVTEGVSLEGQTILITGVNSGLGKESARVLAKRGAFIVAAARTREKAQNTLDELAIQGTSVACELSDPASVKAAIKTINGLKQPLDVVLCNAGIMALPERQQANGLELQFMTNHVGHFMLVNGVLESLNEKGRVVVVSSGAHRMAPKEGIVFDDLSSEKSYDPWKQYGQSKLANILFARALNKRFEGSKKFAAAVHPGVIATNLGRNNPDVVGSMIENMDPSSVKSIAQGAATQCLLAARPDLKDAGGKYWSDCQPAKSTPPAKDDELAERLWVESEKIIAGF